MKKLYFLFATIMISQNLFAIEKTWTGATSTDWANVGNWSPSGVPRDTDFVKIVNRANMPVILSGTIATCYGMNIEGASTLTINSGGILTILPTNATVNNKGINVFSNGTLTNNGTITATTTANINLIVLNDNTTFNNNGTVNLNTPGDGIQVGGPNTKLNNNASGIINFQGSVGIRNFGNQAGSIISNQGTMNFIGSSYFLITSPLNLIVNNSGTFDIKSGFGMGISNATVNNLACGKILMPTTTYENSTASSTITNAGLIIANRILNNVGNFINSGVLKYNTLAGTITNSTNSVVVNSTTPIFTYSGTYDGTINGIFTDSLATVSAGTFTAPNTFIASATLPTGSQTLYAKITPSGGACAYTVPFTFFVVSATASITWTGSVNTDWNNPANWSVNSIPTATNPVIIPKVTNSPVVLSGTMANCARMNIEGSAILTINNGGTLSISPTNATLSDKGISLFSNATLTNNGTLNATTTANINLIVLNDNTTFNNNGTVNLNAPIEGILMGGPNTKLNNNASGIINFQCPKGINTFTGQAGNIISNQGIMNFTGSNYFIVNPATSLTINNSGTIDLKNALGMIAGGAIVNNLACGKIVMLTGSYENNATGSVTTNTGLIIAAKVINSVGNFTNTGILKYNSLTGTITNSTNSVVVNNTTPIFTYNGTYTGTINGIFTDSLATVSAGIFAAPNTFTPLATLPKTSQTVYAKITLSGGVCSYSVPFTYNNMASATKDLSNIVILHQNRPNPFSQETVIAFDLIETNKVVLTVYDINGRQVFTSNKAFNIGYNEVILGNSIFKHTGTYFYRLTSDSFSMVKRLQVIAE